jgi:hypothetical protein
MTRITILPQIAADDTDHDLGSLVAAAKYYRARQLHATEMQPVARRPAAGVWIARSAAPPGCEALRVCQTVSPLPDPCSARSPSPRFHPRHPRTSAAPF